MGRYYSGMISGKFWFGVQSSDDASFFGGQESEPSYLEYYFDKGDLEDIKEGVHISEFRSVTHRQILLGLQRF